MPGRLRSYSSSGSDDSRSTSSSNGYSRIEAPVEAVLQQDKSMPIAIVGMACRLPGEATSPDKLWELCAKKEAAWSEIPKD